MKWYEFKQNNSGGSFVTDKDVDVSVFIEAKTASEANDKAEDIGIYFNGRTNGADCPCCGDRWYPVSKGDGRTKLEKYCMYSNRWLSVRRIYAQMFTSSCIVYYANGKKEKIVFKTKKDCRRHVYKQVFGIGKRCTKCGVWKDES